MRFLCKIVFFFFSFLFLTFPALAISEGDLIINEIMKDPQVVSDNDGEWFELYNPTGQVIDLRGIEIKDGNTTNPDHFLIEDDNPISIPALGYFVLGHNDNPGQNGGVNVNYQYSNFFLSNSDDEIIILSGTTEIDRIEYDDGENFPDPTGASMALLDPGLDNNIGSNWSTSSTPYGDGDLGTPGEANFPASTSTPTPTPTQTLTPTETSTPTPTSSPAPTLTPTSSPVLTPSGPHFPYGRFFQKRLRGFISRLFGLFRPYPWFTIN